MPDMAKWIVFEQLVSDSIGANVPCSAPSCKLSVDAFEYVGDSERGESSMDSV